MAQHQVAVIIGAGPAGLTAAYELLKRTDIKPIVLEMDTQVGGISKTINYKGNRIDLGGHRFFSKSDRVLDWWLNMLPLQELDSLDDSFAIHYHNRSKTVQTNRPEKAPIPEHSDNVMLLRNRLSRIFYLKKFFDYPLSINVQTISNLGISRLIKIGFSYTYAKAFPIKQEKTLEDFIINRFGKELYKTFFKDYTEKVWGIPCNQISSAWGQQRIKGLSITRAIMHALRKQRGSQRGVKQVETSLIERFLYPKFGPGQMWEATTDFITKNGGEVHLNHEVVAIQKSGEKLTSVTCKDKISGEQKILQADYVFSTMPIKDLINALTGDAVPKQIFDLANGLRYRDFITVGLLVNKMKMGSEERPNIVPDNWIYIQESEVKLGRLQIFNNWSPYMVSSEDKVWLGLEYFCDEGDELWSKKDEDFKAMAIQELEKIGMIDSKDVLDGCIIRVKKAYPAYFGTYQQFDVIKDYIDSIQNLFLIGRNGMHKYNNQDHSMLTAMTAVDNIVNNIDGKENIWNINTEEEYHEEK
ncbi:MAG: NAD(P)/FAD-dependent oxidoreductase [Saprospiraceae bacterium]|nr:NAD(P)/FAD-dependent oxidoreductase [Saprospiraceae bacterium]